GQDAKITCLTLSALVFWLLGYPDQALKRSHEAIDLARQLAHPFRLAWTLNFTAMLHQYCQKEQAVQEQAEALVVLSTEQGFPYWLALGTVWWGWALTKQRRGEEGITKLQQGIADYRATGAELAWSYWLALLAEAYGKEREVEKGLTLIAEALAFIDRTRECMNEAELYRLKGELTLQQSSVHGPESEAEA